jgi:hypothetical protein
MAGGYEGSMAKKLTNIVALSAWNAAVAYSGTPSNYPGKTFDNVGWVAGTKSAGTNWGAYIWVLQNQIAFQSSTSSWWKNENCLPVVISNVFVGSLGNYGPMSNVVDIGPHLDAMTYPGAGQSTTATYQVDYTNVYYEVVIPDIFINPVEAFVPIGSTNPVQFKVYGTNIPHGVTWSTIPDLSVSGGAKIISNGAWQAKITPGSVVTNYKVRATSKDNTNFCDQVNLTVLKVELTFADPDDSNWGDLEEKKVILSDQDTRIKLTVTPQISDLQTIFNALGTTLTIKTTGTAPDGENYTLTTQNTTLVQGDDYSELRVALSRADLKSLGVLPSQEDDGITEKAWYDTGDPNYSATSNLRDGEAFESAMSATSRGRCTQVGDLNSTPPNSPLDASFFKAAGVEIITAEYSGAASVKRQVMNQADFFYYSGHGWHLSGVTAAGGPSDVSDYWDEDLNVAIIAGCSVLDINDYENHFTNSVEDHTRSPGKDWEPLGPGYLLGYNYKAPNDLEGSDTVISSWCANYGSSGVVDAWKDANNNRHCRNACAIVASTSYFYFHRIMRGVYVWTEIPKSEW